MGRRTALALATAAYALCFAGWTLIGALGPQISASFRLSAAQTGLLVILPVLVGCIARIPVGILADRWGGRKVFVALLLLLVPPAVLPSAGFARNPNRGSGSGTGTGTRIFAPLDEFRE